MKYKMSCILMSMLMISLTYTYILILQPSYALAANLCCSSPENITHYYAVICACSRYKLPYCDIPKGAPAPDSKLRVLYNALLQTKNWDKDKIILLLNENATKQNIIYALEKMSIIVGTNDIFLFTWNGHGDEIRDTDGDELQWDHNDLYDEVICPYDFNISMIDNIMTLTNVISDDELDFYFSNIQAKGKCLIFESCLSGGLVDKKTLSLVRTEIFQDKGESNVFNRDFLRDITNSESLDVNGNNTIIMMLTLSDTLGLATYVTHSPFLYSVANTIIHNKNYDKNYDGFLSAEEIFQIARPMTLIQSSLKHIYLYITLYLRYRFLWTPLLSYYIPLIKKFCDILFLKPIRYTIIGFPLVLLWEQLLVKLLTGHYFLNWPNMQDDYPGEMPLVQL